MIPIDPNNPITRSALFPNNNPTDIILAKMIGIVEPFYIEKTQLDEENFILNIYLSTHKRNLFTSPCCNEPNCKIHSYIPRKVRTLDCFNYQTFLHYRKPRIRCNKCGKIITINLPWESPNTTLTTIFEDRVVALAEKMPFTSVGQAMGITDKRSAIIVERRVTASRINVDLSKVTKIAVDETSEAKGHKYITVFIDMETKGVIFITEGKDASVLEKFAAELITKNGHPDNITDVAIDMSPAFIAGVNRYFPNASITFDKFHVVKLVNEALDQVRRSESKNTPILKGTRFIWLHNPINLTLKQQELLKILSNQRLKTGRAYRYKLTLQDIYKQAESTCEAESQFKRLISWGLKSRLDPIINVAKSLRSHLSGLLNFFNSGLTSDIIEGANSRIQEIKRRSKGFRNSDNFINIIYLVLGKLPISRLYCTGLPVTSPSGP
jgi:transposase